MSISIVRTQLCLGHYLRIIPLIAALVLLVACNPALALHPLYTDQDVAFDGRLLGTWIDPDDADGSLVIEKNGATWFRITVSDSNSSDKIFFNAHLVNISGYLFLDAVQQSSGSQDESDDSFRIPGHIIVRVWLGEDSLRLSYLDEDGVLDDDPVGKTVVGDAGTVLTGSTSVLQRFVIEHADDNAVFAQDGDELHRKE